MRILFAGTPEFALPALEAAAAAPHQLVGVLTQPDRPAGRGRKLVQGPIKQRALTMGVPVLQPETLKQAGIREELEALAPEVAVVAAYGLLLPRWLLHMPAHGCINVHASLLPRWRGAAPIARAIQAGDACTGITIMQMARGLDTGDILLQKELAIAADATAGQLHDQLAEQGGVVLRQALTALAAGGLEATPQDHASASHASLLSKSEARLDWERPAAELARSVRAFNPWPVAFSELAGQRVRIWQARPIAGDDGVPGTVVAAGDAGIDVATGDGTLRLGEVQWPGKRRIAAAEAARGRALIGTRFG